MAYKFYSFAALQKVRNSPVEQIILLILLKWNNLKEIS